MVFFLILLTCAAENSPTHASENNESTSSNGCIINILIGNETITMLRCDSLARFRYRARNLNAQNINLQLELKATTHHITWDSRVTAEARMIISKPSKRLLQVNLSEHFTKSSMLLTGIFSKFPQL